jgi:hypothetical protein
VSAVGQPVTVAQAAVVPLLIGAMGAAAVTAIGTMALSGAMGAAE